MGTIHRVANAAEFNAALSIVEAGDTIVAEAGEYGEVAIFGANYDVPITITSADPNNKATFEKFNFFNTTGVTLDGINIDLEPEGDTGYLIGVRVTGGGDITIRNNVMTGGYETVEGNEELSSKPVGNAVFVLNSENIIVENNDISEYHAGIALNKTDGVQILNNHIHDIRTTPLGGGGVDNIVIDSNHFSTIRPYEFGGTGDHGDHIHFYPVAGHEGRAVNMTITNNFFEQGDSPTAILGVFLQSHGTEFGYQNVIISNNVLHNSNAQGIRVEHADNLTITNNTLLQAATGNSKDAPGIYVLKESSNAVIDNNITSGAIWGTSIDDAGQLNNVLTNNIRVQRSDVNGENYVGDLFVNPLVHDAELSDLVVIPGSAADGVGAPVLQYGASDDLTFGIISNTPGAGFAVKTVTFDMELIYAQSKEVDIDTATIEWDFGDGTSGTGETIAHTYDRAGRYDVTVRITPEDGTAFEVRKTVEVATAVGLHGTFENGPGDASEIVNSTKVVGDVSYVQSELGTSLRLSGEKSAIQYETNDEILNQRNYTLSLAFKKDGGVETESGSLIYFPGTAYLGTKKGEISFGATTSTGDGIKLRYEGDELDDGNWHQVSYSFSADKQLASLYVDGVLVDQQTEVSGIQYTVGSHKLNVGSLFGSGFSGLIDEVRFLRSDINEEQAAEDFKNLFNGSASAESLVTLQAEDVVAQPVSLLEQETPTPAPAPAPTPVAEPTTPDIQEPDAVVLAESDQAPVEIPVVAAPVVTPEPVSPTLVLGTPAGQQAIWEAILEVEFFADLFSQFNFNKPQIETFQPTSVGLGVFSAGSAAEAQAAEQNAANNGFDNSFSDSFIF